MILMTYEKDSTCHICQTDIWRVQKHIKAVGVICGYFGQSCNSSRQHQTRSTHIKFEDVMLVLEVGGDLKLGGDGGGGTRCELYVPTAVYPRRVG